MDNQQKEKLSNKISSFKYNESLSLVNLSMLAKEYSLDIVQFFEISLDIQPRYAPNREKLYAYFMEELRKIKIRPTLDILSLWLVLVDKFISPSDLKFLYRNFIICLLSEIEENKVLVAQHKSNFAPWVDMQIQECEECLTEIWQYAATFSAFETEALELDNREYANTLTQEKDRIISPCRLLTRIEYNTCSNILVPSTQTYPRCLFGGLEREQLFKNRCISTFKRFRNTKVSKNNN